MKNNQIFNIIPFEQTNIRRVYDPKSETWYFSVVDIIAVLADSSNPTDYLKKLRKRDDQLGAYLGTNCPQVEMMTETGKKRKILAGNVEHILRIIQAIPSKKAEPIKRWLAKVGFERVQEMNDPERALNRSREYWAKHGRSAKWIQQRMMGQETRNKLTDYWKEHGVNKGDEYAILTNIIHQEWTELSVMQHKQLKGLKSQNLRDHMNEAELILTALAELSTRQIAEGMQARGLNENEIPAIRGGQVARKARIALEAQTGNRAVTCENYLPATKRVLL